MSDLTNNKGTILASRAPLCRESPQVPVSNEHMEQLRPPPVHDTAPQLADSETNNKGPRMQERTGGVLEEIPHLYRLVDLIQEDGPDGMAMVEKTVVDQHSLRLLLNTMQPGSCPSTTEIHFQDLDNLSIRPLGLYGERREIAMFLQQKKFLDDNSVALIIGEESGGGSPNSLSTGLYMALLPIGEEEQTISACIIYWPEVTTWDDQAASLSVLHNRTTFMRYLTKITDQLVALISSSQAQALIWEAEARRDNLPTEQIRSNSQLSSFQVTKSTNHESVSVQPGFVVTAKSNGMPDYNEASQTRLISGEPRVALLIINREEKSLNEEHYEGTIDASELQAIVESDINGYKLQLGDVSPVDIDILDSMGLRRRYKSIFEGYDRIKRELNNKRAVSRGTENSLIRKQLEQDEPKVRAEIQFAVRFAYDTLYPSLDLELDAPHDPQISDHLYQNYSGLRELRVDLQKEQNIPYIIHDETFQTLKRKWPFLRERLTQSPSLSETRQRELIERALGFREPLRGESDPSSLSTVASYLVTGLLRPSSLYEVWNTSLEPLSDPDFVEQVQLMKESHPVLSEFAQTISARLRTNLEESEQGLITEHLDTIMSTEQRRQITLAGDARELWYRDAKKTSFGVFLDNLREAMQPNEPYKYLMIVDQLSASGRNDSNVSLFHWSGEVHTWSSAQNRYSIYPLGLTEQGNRSRQDDDNFIPQPKLEVQNSFGFRLPESWSIQLIHLIHDKCLVVVSDEQKTLVYVENDAMLERAIDSGRSKIAFNHDSFGGSRYKFAYDQTTRLLALAIVHGEEGDPRLSIYVFDEEFTPLRDQSSPISLKNSYSELVEIDQICFIPGLEEICLVGTSGLVRIYSLINQQFRKGFLQVGQPIVHAFPDLDGSRLLLVVQGEAPSATHRLLAIQWDSFQKRDLNNGDFIAELPPSDGHRVMSRLGTKSTHLISLPHNSHTITSVILQVKQTGARFFQQFSPETFCNSLLDCHLDVWTRYPIAAPREMSWLSSSRKPKGLILVSPIPLPKAERYFSALELVSKRAAVKVSKDTLLSITVVGSNEDELDGYLVNNKISEFKMGAYAQELLCLVPLQLVIARADQIYTKDDGVWNSHHNALPSVGDVVYLTDSLRLAWYEPLFQLNPISKPVRVITSIGERGVGKTYSLDHIANTSFGVCGDHDSQGVWLSCVPTEEYMLVALDFQGVHLTEQNNEVSALMGMFSAAISHLVILRNNFTITSYPAELTTGLLALTRFMDPENSPEIFHSMLAIVFKDVSDPNACATVKKFSYDFQKSIEDKDKRGSIPSLHRGGIQVVPWPGINTTEFYMMSTYLQDQLVQQRLIHPNGGVFSHNLKILLAKIKARDWAPLNQSLARYRVKKLMESLTDALQHGQGRAGPLKNMQNDEVIHPSHGHTTFSFWVPNFGGEDSFKEDAPIEPELPLRKLTDLYEVDKESRQQVPDADYVKATQKGIHDLLEQRLEFVARWAAINTKTFPQDNPDICEFLERLASAKISMRDATRAMLHYPIQQ
ncbi:unnamed protein product [Rhizoctonia solani]|uniref:Uncharacterized protein n=1 Tax=Rhizoctonia solani TaxID=456999 RepID=A0A8H3BBE5_9AGAM|nr:unnamed protein product [Rhizoctonia solani]